MLSITFTFFNVIEKPLYRIIPLVIAFTILTYFFIQKRKIDKISYQYKTHILEHTTDIIILVLGKDYQEIIQVTEEQRKIILKQLESSMYFRSPNETRDNLLLESVSTLKNKNLKVRLLYDKKYFDTLFKRTPIYNWIYPVIKDSFTKENYLGVEFYLITDLE